MLSVEFELDISLLIVLVAIVWVDVSIVEVVSLISIEVAVSILDKLVSDGVEASALVIRVVVGA